MPHFGPLPMEGLLMSRKKVLDSECERICLSLSSDLAKRLRVYAIANELTLSQAGEKLLEGPLAALSGVIGTISELGSSFSKPIPQSDPRKVPEGWTGKDLRERLESLGLTQKEFGQKFNLPQQTVSAWVRNGIPKNRQIGIARVLASLPWPPKD